MLLTVVVPSDSPGDSLTGGFVVLDGDIVVAPSISALGVVVAIVSESLGVVSIVSLVVVAIASLAIGGVVVVIASQGVVAIVHVADVICSIVDIVASCRREGGGNILILLTIEKAILL